MAHGSTTEAKTHNIAEMALASYTVFYPAPGWRICSSGWLPFAPKASNRLRPWPAWGPACPFEHPPHTTPTSDAPRAPEGSPRRRPRGGCARRLAPHFLPRVMLCLDLLWGGAPDRPCVAMLAVVCDGTGDDAKPRLCQPTHRRARRSASVALVQMIRDSLTPRTPSGFPLAVDPPLSDWRCFLAGVLLRPLGVVAGVELAAGASPWQRWARTGPLMLSRSMFRLQSFMVARSPSLCLNLHPTSLVLLVQVGGWPNRRTDADLRGTVTGVFRSQTPVARRCSPLTPLSRRLPPPWPSRLAVAKIGFALPLPSRPSAISPARQRVLHLPRGWRACRRGVSFVASMRPAPPARFQAAKVTQIVQSSAPRFSPTSAFPLDQQSARTCACASQAGTSTTTPPRSLLSFSPTAGEAMRAREASERDLRLSTAAHISTLISYLFFSLCPGRRCRGGLKGPLGRPPPGVCRVGPHALRRSRLSLWRGCRLGPPPWMHPPGQVDRYFRGWSSRGPRFDLSDCALPFAPPRG